MVMTATVNATKFWSACADHLSSGMSSIHTEHFVWTAAILVAHFVNYCLCNERRYRSPSSARNHKPNALDYLRFYVIPTYLIWR
ncbi:hypothetical protein JTB14_000752 [Gonioctena quinquepunctata]|nr:hypothetical protein JTB14_000752 [Gonioctena quinquepunctata]